MSCAKPSEQSDLAGLIKNELKPKLDGISKPGRLLTETEVHKLTTRVSPNTLLSESDSYTLGSCCELVSQVLSGENNGGCENGLVFVNRSLDMTRNSTTTTSFETILADLVLEKHAHLKRIMLLDWDRTTSEPVKRRYETDPRLLTISISPRSDLDHSNRFDQIGTDAGAGFNMNIEINNVRVLVYR